MSPTEVALEVAKQSASEPRSEPSSLPGGKGYATRTGRQQEIFLQGNQIGEPNQCNL